jgi:hypothetical protein
VAEALDRAAAPSRVLELCARCAALYADLLALTTALPLAAHPARRRDFTLSPADARRLRPRGWRGWWPKIGTARDSFTRPLAIGFTTMGLVGLLLTAAPTSSILGASSGAAPAATENLHVVMGQPGEGSADPAGPGTANPPRDVAEGRVISDPNPALALSLGLLAAGGGLFAARRIAGHGRPVR